MDFSSFSFSNSWAPKLLFGVWEPIYGLHVFVLGDID